MAAAAPEEDEEDDVARPRAPPPLLLLALAVLCVQGWVWGSVDGVNGRSGRV